MDTITTPQKDVISAKHPMYDAAQMQRQLYQDMVAGTLRLREKRAQYFPRFPREKDASYAYRVDTATAFNLTRKTQDVMIGLVFNEPIQLEPDVPAELVTLWEDTDNQGTHGDVFWRQAACAAFEGYAAVLEDSPNAKANSLEDQRVQGLRPYSILWKADDIWNWRYRVNPISKRKELEMIVLRSVTDEPDGNYITKPVTRFMHIFQEVNGPVQWERFIEVKENKVAEPKYIPDGAGVFERQTAIPISVIRCLGDPPPFLDIAVKNIQHTQVYSDYMNVVHKTCVPFAVRIGYVPSQEPQAEQDNDTLIDVPENGDFKFAEVAGGSIAATRQTLADMEQNIALMGLSLLADKTAKVDLTATEALLNNIGETAELRVFARQVQDALELSFQQRAAYLGEKSGGSVVMGTSWNVAERKAEEAAAAAMDVPPGTSGASAMVN